MSWFDENGFQMPAGGNTGVVPPWITQGGAVAAAGAPLASPSAPSFDQVNAAMLAATGRPESQQEFGQFWNFDPAGGAADWQTNWQQTIANSPEAQAYKARQAQPMSAMATPAIPATPSFTPTAPMAAPTPFALPTAAEAANTPGYQFTRDQGIQGVLRSDIARGFGIGGAALKDIAQFSTGLADQYYGNRVAQAMGANAQNFGQNLATNQFNQGSNLANFGANLSAANFGLGAQNQFWNQGFNENRNAFDQYDRSQQSAFDQWYKLAQLGNPGNPYA